MENRQGLLIVHTGNGKGKTTAALGLALRAWGNGYKTLILQFIKGSWKYGELKALQQLSPGIVIQQMGEGFSQKDHDDKEKHIAAAKKTLEIAKREIISGSWDMIILDELNYALKFGLIQLEPVMDLIALKSNNLHLVITGREAREEIIACADLVTEMKEIKHPYKQGVKAQKGIEF
ncbi:cob(I)yrinic acid a,c-diamide adenosyltransferase [Anaerosinus massiliensis]|uniref:cob(I)yrinic acid a,c-diamide adenosyltransferase n=1 Tax=Massilibacillus massiliensis TaxID=1806837 RepID=UPI000A4B12D9|nr:cob(I)yrinic acid a,c-diamide adenosyltransferase [Massilibacillus massiliensis]